MKTRWSTLITKNALNLQYKNINFGLVMYSETMASKANKIVIKANN